MKKIKHIFNKDCTFMHSGWSNACSAFGSNKHGIVNLDVFFEASFEWMHTPKLIENLCKKYPKEDFIAIIHNPFDTYRYEKFVKFSNVKPYPDCILELLQKHCKGLFFMCKAEALKFRNYFKSIGLNIKCNHLYHPIQNFEKKFSFNKFFNNPNKLLIQSGMHLRKASTPFLIASDFLNSDIDIAYVPWESRNQYSLEKEVFFKKLDTKNFHLVKKINQLEYEEYIDLYRSNIFLLDLHEVTSCNVVLDCISTHTPLIVKRLPANEEYLGKDYPLFFNNIDEIYQLTKDYSILKDAHLYLRSINKDRFSLPRFQQDFLTSDIYQSL